LIRKLSLLVALLVLVATACSSGSSPTASEAPTATPLPSLPAAESDAPGPSFNEGAGELADLLPTEVNGIPIEYESFTGMAGLGEMTDEEQAFIDRLGVDPSQVVFASGIGGDFASEDGFILITATKVPGVDTNTLRSEFISVIETESEATAEERTIGGKTVTAFVSEEEGDIGFVYVNGDVVFSVYGLPESLSEEAIAQLP
jgi:hypothetical protein